MSRRSMLGCTMGALGTLGLAACVGHRRAGVHQASPAGPSSAPTSIALENAHAGDPSWRPTHHKLINNLDLKPQISGYASRTSLFPGESISFFVSTPSKTDFRVSIYRLGNYRSAGGRLMGTSPTMHGGPQAKPTVSLTGAVRCEWQPSWSQEIPKHWASGLYLAQFTTAGAHRNVTPFVVKSARPSEILVVAPFATYQAYNHYPTDGLVGKSLYYGFIPLKSPAVLKVSPDGHAYGAKQLHGTPYGFHYPERARTVSFQRPYADAGYPSRFDLDASFVGWAEGQGYDVTYATSLDLDAGLIRPGDYRAVIFCGHDEYWSQAMRDFVAQALAHGTNLAFMAANSMYWHVRTAQGPAGFTEMTCYKTDPDPSPDGTGQTCRWRDMSSGHARAEQGLLGTQYTGIVAAPAPLVITEPKHWFWAGTGLQAGDRIAGLVNGEADGLDRAMPRPPGAKDQVLLSASPFQYRPNLNQVQSTSVYVAASGSLVFNAGTFGWNTALDPSNPASDSRIAMATKNLADRLRT